MGGERALRSGKQFRVLMLGWEYPPRFAGGLGKACQGLSQAMAKQGAQVFFVLPSFPERLSEPHLEVVGALEVLTEAGWDPAQGIAPWIQSENADSDSIQGLSPQERERWIKIKSEA